MMKCDAICQKHYKSDLKGQKMRDNNDRWNYFWMSSHVGFAMSRWTGNIRAQLTFVWLYREFVFVHVFNDPACLLVCEQCWCFCGFCRVGVFRWFFHRSCLTGSRWILLTLVEFFSWMSFHMDIHRYCMLVRI